MRSGLHKKAMANGILITVRCRFCSKPRNPKEFIGGPTVGFCLDCLTWHEHALKVLAGEVPKGCQECGATMLQVAERTPGGDVPMRMHVKDGIYQLLCVPCSDVYERKRMDLYGDTPYGHQNLRSNL